MLAEWEMGWQLSICSALQLLILLGWDVLKSRELKWSRLRGAVRRLRAGLSLHMPFTELYVRRTQDNAPKYGFF